MTNGDGSKTTKIVLSIIGGVVVLGLICCVGGWFLIPKEARNLMGEGVQMAKQMAEGVQAFDKGFADDFGEDGRWELGGGGHEALLLVGVSADTELDEATVADLQDRAWRRYTSAFSGGGIPVNGVAIGHAGKRNRGPDSYQGVVSSWAKNVADIEMLVERTGIEAPATSEFFESIEQLEGGGVNVEVDSEGNAIRVDVKAGSEDEAVPVPVPDEQE
jgi:hypothetical protein